MSGIVPFTMYNKLLLIQSRIINLITSVKFEINSN